MDIIYPVIYVVCSFQKTKLENMLVLLQKNLLKSKFFLSQIHEYLYHIFTYLFSNCPF